MAFLPPVVMELRAKATEVYSELGKVTAETKVMAAETEAQTGKMQLAYKATASAGKALTLGIVGAAAVIGGFSVEAAASAQVTDAKLSVAVKNAGGNMEALEPKISKAQSAMRNYGFSNNDAKDALGTLTTALKSPQDALKDISVAADLARAKHIDLNQAALLVAKTQEGQVRGLKSLGIDLPVAAASAAQVAKAQDALAAAQAKANGILAATPDAANASSKAHKAYETALNAVSTAQANLTSKQNAGSQLLDGLKQRIGGAANAYGKTFAGQLTAARSAVENMGEKIGSALIPIIQNVIKVGQQWANYLNKNRPVLIAIAAIIGGVLLIAIGAYIVSMASAAIATIAATWPLLLIIVAVGLLVAAILWLVANWKTVSKFIGDVWSNVGKFFLSVGTAIDNWWKGFWGGIIGFVRGIWDAEVRGWTTIFRWFHDTMVTIGTAIITWWNGFWGGIIGFVSAVWNAGVRVVTDGFNWLYNTLVGIGTTIIAWWNGLWTGVASFVSSVWKGAGNAIIGFLNGVIDMVNGLIGGINTVLDGVKTISGGAINLHIGKIPHLPSFDVGGTVPGAPGAPMLATVHGAERILTVAQSTGRAPLPPDVQALAARGQPAGVSKHNEVKVYATTNADSLQIAGDVGWELRKLG